MGRQLKVQDTGDYYRKEQKPSIRLEGKWLVQAGILGDDVVEVEVISAGEIHIKKKENVTNEA